LAVERLRQLHGTGLPLRGDDIDTDRIIPARFLKSISFEGLEGYLFEDDRREAASSGGPVHPVDNPAYAGASVIAQSTPCSWMMRRRPPTASSCAAAYAAAASASRAEVMS